MAKAVLVDQNDFADLADLDDSTDSHGAIERAALSVLIRWLGQSP